MQLTVLVIVFFAALASSSFIDIPADWDRPLFTDDLYQASWTQWCQKFSRKYEAAEEPYRFMVFQQNMDFVATHNSAEHTFTVELNKFADLKSAEFVERYTGLRRALPQKVAGSSFNETGAPKADSWDWRTQGAVTGVKDQGQCGSCWAFSTTGSVEGAHQLATGKLVSLSEQNLMDCSWSYGNLGCNGGLMDSAFKYIIDNKGIDTEASYPYTAKSSRTAPCKYSAANSGATISSYVDVKPSGSESSLLTAVGKTPVSVAIDASQTSFQLYKSGVYYEPKCSSSNLDHGVLAAGWGTETVGGDYWLVKNSWGVSWGMQGYIEMARNENNNCGIATEASYPIV